MSGLGILSSIDDLPKTKALGLEFRSTAGFGAPVSMVDGSFGEEPFRIYHKLDGTPEQVLSTLCATIDTMLDKFVWKGVVGISITKEVSGRLGVFSDDFAILETEVGAMLTGALAGKVSFVHTVVHTDAAGYNELVWGESARKEVWDNKSIVVCTLGKHIGAVLFSDGHRVRSSPMKSVARLPGEAPDGRFMPPDPGTPGYKEWTDAIDASLADILESVPSVDQVIMLPTGRTAAAQGLTSNLKPTLHRAHEVAARKNCTISVSAQTPGSVIRGVALCALVELESKQVMKSLETVLNGEDALHMLSEAQLRVIFDRMDASGSGRIPVESLQEALRLLGMQRDMEKTIDELDSARTGVVRFDGFLDWWSREVRQARVVRVTSADAFKSLLSKTPPEGFGDLVVMEVTFTFCRSCRKFEKSFHTFAEEFRDVRFVQFMANATIGGMEYCTKDLAVKTSPAFFVFRRGSEEILMQWSGANLERFSSKLTEAVALAKVKA